MTAIARSLAGLWLGLWFIAGFGMGVGGILILAVQGYGWLSLGFWLPVTLKGICRGFEISIPQLPWPEAQRALDVLLLLPASGVFILCGLHIALMAIVAKRNIEKRISRPPLTVAAESHRALDTFGITTLHIHGS